MPVLSVTSACMLEQVCGCSSTDAAGAFASWWQCLCQLTKGLLQRKRCVASWVLMLLVDAMPASVVYRTKLKLAVFVTAAVHRHPHAVVKTYMTLLEIRLPGGHDSSHKRWLKERHAANSAFDRLQHKISTATAVQPGPPMAHTDTRLTTSTETYFSNCNVCPPMPRAASPPRQTRCLGIAISCGLAHHHGSCWRALWCAA